MKYNKRLRKYLLRKIKQLAVNDKPILVSVEDFFMGNYDEDSIGVNLVEHPGIDFFANRFKELKGRDDIDDILIEIYEVEKGVWPFSEKVWIVTKLNIDDLKEITEELCCDEIFKEDQSDISVPDGYTTFSLWWD